VNRKRVLRLMRSDNLLCLRKRRFVCTTDSRHTYAVYPNLTRDWKPTAINQLWVSDITYIRLRESFLYLAVILDAYSRRVIGWALEERLDTELTVKALQRALAERSVSSSGVHHSDRGVQYCAKEYVDLLKTHDFQISMSRTGNPYDNAKCESFMKTLKCEEIHAGECRGMEDLRKNISTFVDVYYNTQRLHSALGYNTPEQFEATLSPSIAGGNGDLSFARHREIFQTDRSGKKKPPEGGLPNHRLDESPAAYSSPGWSPPAPDSASPASLILKCGRVPRKTK
jgi:putative transposase